MHRTRRLTGLIAATAFVVTVPMVAQGVDLGVGSDAFVEQADAGTLTLASDDGDTLTLTYEDADGSLLAEESATLRNRDKCLVPTGDFTLLDIAVTGGDVGLVSNGLGSRESNNCSTGNGRLEVGQTLTLTLGDGLPADVRVDDAVLDLEGKFGADARVVTLLGTAAAGDDVVDLEGDASDNGADAGAADNTHAAIGAAGDTTDDFTVLQLSVEDAAGDGRGEVALEGGGDWDLPADTRTVFNLVRVTGYEYALDCGDTVTDVGDPDFGDTESGAEAYSLTRYSANDSDATGTEGSCDPIGADLSSDGDGVLFRKTTTDSDGDEQDPTTRLTLTWHVPLYEADGVTPRSTEDVEADLAREIDLLDGNGSAPVQFCLANNDTGGLLAPATKPADTPWCLLDESISVGNGYAVQVQVYDGSGDPVWR